MTSIVYLHGFASSPGSQKAQTIQGRFAALGVPVSIPDLNVPSFERLTLTAMIDETARAIANCP
ncbi:MAG: YqiA/YcfP family alpha/beta fold hydrolase, partial [Aggregatilineales bacterium]